MTDITRKIRYRKSTHVLLLCITRKLKNLLYKINFNMKLSLSTTKVVIIKCVNDQNFSVSTIRTLMIPISSVEVLIVTLVLEQDLIRQLLPKTYHVSMAF